MRKITKKTKSESISNLKKRVISLREEIAKGSLSFKTSLPKDTNTIIKKRKKLAFLLTIIKEKEDLEKLKILAKDESVSGNKKLK